MTKIVILNGIGYLVPSDKIGNANIMSDIEYDDYKRLVKTYPIHGTERTISDKEFANLETKNWHR